MSDQPAWAVEAARPDWSTATPTDPETGDIYFSRAGGREESACVFLDGNRLGARWAALDPARPGVFVLGETGFGSGLNYLLACQLFDAVAPTGWQLHYLAVEHRPWRRADLARAHHDWPDLAPYSAALIEAWPAFLRGPHRLHPAPGRIRLTLWLDDIVEALRELEGCVHAWFLDGFAPACNPDMWTTDVCALLARCSAPGATFGTYTAAGAVRKGLAAAGFEVRRLPGFAGKRHRLAGHLPGAPLPPAPRPDSAVVIGAGFAGCAVAHALSGRGIPVTLLEAKARPGGGASGVPRAVLYVKLSGACSDVARLQLQALSMSQSLLARSYTGPGMQGMLQLADPGQAERWQALAGVPPELLQVVGRAAALRLAGMDPGAGGLWFPQAWAVDGGHWCQDLLGMSQLQARYGEVVETVESVPDARWQITTPGSTFSAPLLVTCTGAGRAGTAPLHGLGLRPIRGQLTRVTLPAETGPRCVLTGRGHVVPLEDGTAWTGSSYVHGRTDLAPDAGEQSENLQRLAKLLGTTTQKVSVAPDWVQLRAAGPDHLPAAGPLPGPAGHHVIAGLRSRGLLFTPLLAECIASLACGEPLPVTRAQWRLLQVSRWLG